MLQKLAQQVIAGEKKVQQMSDSGAIQRTLAGDPLMAAVYRWVENNLDRKKMVGLAAGFIQNLSGFER